MMKDLPGYTFVWCNVYPLANYDSVEPIPNYRQIVENSSLGGSYEGVDLTKQKMIFPIQSYYSYMGNIGLAPGTEEPPSPTLLLAETTDTAAAMTPESEIPAGGIYQGGHTRLMYSAIVVAHPNISEETSGFMDWEQGFGSAIYNDLQFFDSTSEYKFNVNNAGATSYIKNDSGIPEIGGNYSNFDALKQFWDDAHLYGFIPIYAYCKVSHQGNGIEAGSFTTGEEFEGDLSIDARNTQVLIESSCGPMGDAGTLWRETPDGDWDRPRLYGSSNYLRYNKYHPKLHKYDTRLDDGATLSGQDKLFIASAQNFRGSNYGYGGDHYIKDDMKARFPSRDMINDMSDTYINGKIDYFSNLTGKTLQVPKEYRARRQITPTIDASRLSSIADTNQYVMDVAASVPGMTSPTSTSTTPGTSYSAGASAGGGGSTGGGGSY